MEIDLSIPGAREERAKLKRLQVLLNGPDVVPEQSYRPSKAQYSLICYVNTIIGLFLSKNYEVIPLFIGRARRFMNHMPPSPAYTPYYKTVDEYLTQMEYVLRNFTTVSEESLHYCTSLATRETIGSSGDD